MTPRDQLQTVADLVRQHAPPELASWFSDGVQAFITGRQRTLCKALGCRAAGHSAPTTEAAIQRRNQRLCEALSYCDGATPWRRCLALEREIATFEAIVWPRWRELTAPPPGASALRTALFHARKCHPLPTTARALSGISAK